MTLFQFVAVSLFIIVCALSTWRAQREQIMIRRQRDKLAEELLLLTQMIGWYYPEGIHQEDADVVRMKKLLISVVRSENPKE